MGTVEVLVAYELRRVVAKKRVVVLLAATFLLEVGIYYVLTTLPPFVLQQIAQYAWMAGVLAPTLFLIQIAAIVVGASTFAEEYELGTADFWLTRPISRVEYWVGKVLGGLLLIILQVAAYTILAVGISWFTFGAQRSVETLMYVIPATLVAALPFYAIALMLGEIVRRTTIATILSSMILFGSFIFESYANLITAINVNERTLLEITRYLPTWGSLRITSEVMVMSLGDSLPTIGNPLRFLTALSSGGELVGLLVNVLMYSAIALSIVWVRLRYSDVSRKVL